MSDYGAYPPPPPSEGYGQAPSTPAEPPPAIKTSVNIVWAVVALVVLGTILTLLSLDDIVDAVGTDLTSDERDAARTGQSSGPSSPLSSSAAYGPSLRSSCAEAPTGPVSC